MARLGERLESHQASDYVGREAEAGLLRAFLDPGAEERIALIHGAGGAGKSALVRRAADFAAANAYNLTWVDGRELPPVPDALEDALADARRSARPLIVLDSYEMISALDGFLRRGLLPTLPDEARVIVAGREHPSPEWRRDGWEALTVEIAVEPLGAAESESLLRARGLDGAALRDVAAWAQGSPLALRLAARAITDGGVTDASALDRTEVVRALLDQLTTPGATTAHLATLGVAAIARQTTEPMLSGVLDRGDPRAEFSWLASQDFIEPLGEGITPHALVRHAILADLRRREPMLERHLRRRIADHLYAMASTTQNPLWTIDLAHLAESPVLRWGFSWEASASYRVDDPREGDHERITERLGHAPAALESILEHAPEHVTICRGPDDDVCGFAVAMTPGSAPTFCEDDPILGPRLAHARSLDTPGECVVWHSNVDLVGDGSLGVVGLLGMASLLRAALGNPRFGYLPIDPATPGAREFAAAAGAVHTRVLDAEANGHVVECHVMDWGPGGLTAALLEFVYRELGLEPPPRPASLAEGVTPENVRAALRILHDDRALAASPLAGGATAAELRAEIIEAAGSAFDEGRRDSELSQVLLRGYIEPADTHDAAAEHLHLSRASYFRRLREATTRLADELARNRAGQRTRASSSLP